MISPDEIFAIGSNNETPFYLYDMRLLDETLDNACLSMRCNPKFRLNYAMKACAERPVLERIRQFGLGLDTVSGGEIREGIEAGFDPSKILFAGVGKSDKEIDLAISAGIKAFNVESEPELDVIAERAALLGKTARVALRVNPNIDAHTHHFITTGLAENKFGINLSQLDRIIAKAQNFPNIEFVGLHFHIGSQITNMEPFRILCTRVNNLISKLSSQGVKVKMINLGGGLAIDYDNPRENPIADFEAFFTAINETLDTSAVEEVHFELGRALVGQIGHLISRVLYVKNGDERTFAIVDAGMTELIRPALYEARHSIENVSGILRGDSVCKVDVVGPVCESADVFGQDYLLATPGRGDIIDIASAGAYGQSMSSNYNGRSLNPSVFFN